MRKTVPITHHPTPSRAQRKDPRMSEPEILDAQTQINTRPGAQINTAERAVEAEVRAMVEARVLMAYRNPRNMHMVRSRLLESCKRVAFAEQAIYRKPVGSKKVGDEWVKTFAEGPSIRFAEEAIRAMGNTLSEQKIVFEDEQKRIIQFALMDLEGNNTDVGIIVVSKQVERRTLKKDQRAISQRMNSEGSLVYLVEATDDEVAVKAAAMIAKTRRDSAIRLCPSDIKEDCIKQIKKTLMERDKANPTESLNRLLDAFQEKGILPDQIEKYLGHELAIITPAELMALRGVFGAIQDGELTWVQILKDVEEDREAALKAASQKATTRKASKGCDEQGSGQGKGMTEGDTGTTTTPANQEPTSPIDKAKAQARSAQTNIGGGSLDIPT
jgi:hypothetical protein